MSAISVLYAPRDEALGEKIAEALARQGHRARAGSGAPDIDGAAAIVIWSNAAQKLVELHEQAREAFERGALIPVTVGGAAAPSGFENLPPVDLSGWGGDEGDPRWRFVLEEISLAEERRHYAAAATAAETSLSYGAAPEAEPAAQEEITAPLRQPGTGWSHQYWSPVKVTMAGAAVLFGLTAGAFLIAPLIFKRPAEEAVAQEAAPVDLAFLQAAPQTENAPPADEADFEITVTRSGDVLTEREDGVMVAEGDADPAFAQGAASPASAAPATEASGSDALGALLASVTVASVTVDAGAGRVFRDCDACPEMAVLPAGAFSFGSPATEAVRQATEGPVVTVEFAGRFAIGLREVTFAEWNACVAGGGCGQYAPGDAGWGRGDRPVINVSFEDAQAYAAWLTEKTGRTYRLPTEAEWEYAARAGTAAPYAFGGDVGADQANFNGQYPYVGDPGLYRQATTVAGSFAPNAFGLYDMHGNVWEWTADCWKESHAGAPADGSAVGGACGTRVLKGGAWNTGAWRLRSAHRIGKAQTAREFDNGFRVARVMD